VVGCWSTGEDSIGLWAEVREGCTMRSIVLMPVMPNQEMHRVVVMGGLGWRSWHARRHLATGSRWGKKVWAFPEV